MRKAGQSGAWRVWCRRRGVCRLHAWANYQSTSGKNFKVKRTWILGLSLKKIKFESNWVQVSGHQGLMIFVAARGEVPAAALQVGLHKISWPLYQPTLTPFSYKVYASLNVEAVLTLHAVNAVLLLCSWVAFLKQRRRYVLYVEVVEGIWNKSSSII